MRSLPTPPRQPTPLSAHGAWMEPALAQWAAARNPNRPASPSFYTSNAAFFDFLFYLDSHLEYAQQVAQYEKATGLRVVYIKPPHAGLIPQREVDRATAAADAVAHEDKADVSSSSSSSSDDDEAAPAAGAAKTTSPARAKADALNALDADSSSSSSSDEDESSSDPFERAVQAREAAEEAAAAAAVEGRAPALPSWLLKADMEGLLGTSLKTTEYRRIVHRLNAIASEANAYVLDEFLDTFRRSKQADVQVRRKREPDALGRVYATGRRKNAVARVWVVPKGEGDLRVNGMAAAEYFERWGDREIVVRPFRVAQVLGTCNVWSTVHGGGKTGTGS